MTVTQEQRDEYARYWEQKHPGYSADEFYLAYLDEYNNLNENQQFNIDTGMLMGRPSFKPRTIVSTKPIYLSQKAINDFVENWMARHPGYKPEDFSDAYHDNNLPLDDEYWLMEEYIDEYDPNYSENEHASPTDNESHCNSII